MAAPRSRKEQGLITRGLMDYTGELTPLGEEYAEDRYHGNRGDEGDDPRFSEMGPDFLPGTNVIGP